MDHNNLIWHKVLDDKNELAAGRVMTVTAGYKTFTPCKSGLRNTDNKKKTNSGFY